MLPPFYSKAFRLLVLVVFLGFIALPGTAVSGDLKGYQQTLWKHLEAICAIGPRPPGSPALEKLRGYIRSVGKKYADEIREQKFTFQKPGGPAVAMVNIELVFYGKTKKAPLLLGAHYDTRPFADEEDDPYSRKFPILGANDGGSGTAVLLALAQYLHAHKPERPVRLVFFDGEDYGA
jgi:acetylornithine deacetylase/succinyl-diaminopimelate desuccinylase-like protein